MSDQTHESPGTWLGYIEGRAWPMEEAAFATLAHLAMQGRLEAELSVQRDRADSAEAEAKRLGEALLAGEPVESIEALRSRGRPRAINGDVEVLSLKGVLASFSFLGIFTIPNPVETFMARLKESMADDDIGAIVMEIDSPGGVVDGIPEAAAQMRALRAQHNKPVVAHANTMAASAAYWLASQADEVIVTPSGVVGSIGVYATHRDMSGFYEEKMGVKHTLIKAGKFKTEGNPYEGLSDEAAAHLQESVDYFYGLFTADVAKGRGVKQTDVKGGYGEGRVLNAKAAMDANLVDRVETLGETTARLGSRSRGPVKTRAEAEPEHTDVEAEANAGADTNHEDAKQAWMAKWRDDEELAAFHTDRTLDALGV